MPVTRTQRFSLHRWDSGADPFNRTQMDADNLQVETLAALYRVGPQASIGDPTGVANAKSFYYATDTAILYFSDGTNWVSLGDPGETGDIQALAMGSSSSAGSTSTSGGIKTQEFALANHVHALPSSGTPVSVTTTNAAGSAVTLALSDHTHAIASGAINSSGIFSASVVNAAALASDAVTTIKILDANVTADKLASNAVTTAKITNANVTAVKLASDVAGSGLASNSGVLSVNVDDSTIEINSDTLRLKDNGIAAAKLQSDSVTTAKILDANVTAIKLASDVAGSGLASNSGVLSVNVDASTIEINTDTLRLKDNGIAAAKLQSDSVTTAKILDLNVTTGKLAANAVTTGKLASGAVTATELASDAVTTAKILNANVTLAKLASGSVNSSKLAAGVYYNATSNSTGGQIRYGTAAVGTIGGSPSAGDLYFKFI